MNMYLLIKLISSNTALKQALTNKHSCSECLFVLNFKLMAHIILQSRIQHCVKCWDEVTQHSHSECCVISLLYLHQNTSSRIKHCVKYWDKVTQHSHSECCVI